MNLYASDAFLDVLATVFFPKQKTAKRYYSVHGRVFRLLEVDGVPQWNIPFVDYNEPIDSDAIPEGTPIQEGLPFIGNAVWQRVDIADWETHFVASSDAHAIGPRRHPSGGLFRAAPVVEFGRFGDDHDAFLKFLRSKSSLVKSDQRMQRRLSEIPGGFQFLANDPGDDVLPFCFATKSEQTLESLGVDLFAPPEHKALFYELQKRGMLMVSTLRNQKRLLAAWLGVIHEGSWNGWVYVYNRSEEFRKLSVGRQLMYFILKECHSRGLNEFDFSIGEADYKNYFSTSVRVVGPIGQEQFAVRARKTARKAVREFVQGEVYQRAPWVENTTENVLQRIRKRRWEKTGSL